MKYYVVDAFTDRPFGGNPAGVVLLEGNAFPPETLMLQVAAELRYSETAFVRRLTPMEYQVRYFTPKAEVELCGHATIATFSLLHQMGQAEGECLCHTLAGDLHIKVGEKVMMQMAIPRIVATIENPDEVYRAFGVTGYHPTQPVQIAYSGLPDIMIPVSDVATLNGLQPNMGAVSSITQKHKAVSFHVFAFGNDGYTAHVRDFAPLYDIPEESATGTANAALTHYLAVNGVIPPQGDFAFLQGEAMGRPSVVATRIATDGNIYVGGTAYVLASGELNLAKDK
ncbi:MAG: PhzF family phenazine biosynthesis protein [Bacteroidales bacterium]|nr:PhzF family phenazine biosynthesis protein [Bacteroidales bacterium]